MDVPIIISVAFSFIALVIAAEAVVQARRSAKSAERSEDIARRANEISQHNERLNIYKSLQRFRFEVIAHGHAFPDSAIWAFVDAANLSEFYYPQGRYLELKAVLDLAIEVKGLYDEWVRHRESNQFEHAKAVYSMLNSKMKALRQDLEKCDEALRAHLRLEPKDNVG